MIGVSRFAYISIHDTHSLGHARRLLNVARSVGLKAPDSGHLVVTASPCMKLMRLLPPRTDFLKIPTLVRDGAADPISMASIRPSQLPLDGDDLARFRRDCLRVALTGLAPKAALVEFMPVGVGGELIDTLEVLRRNGCRTIFGMRDIVDEPERVREQWTQAGVYDALERYYDAILVYGSRDHCDVASTYGMPPALEAKLVYCGYVTADPAPPGTATAIRERFTTDGPFVMGTVGGGVDGFGVLEAMISALSELKDVCGLVVTGPFMPCQDRARLRSIAGDDGRVRVEEFVDDFASYVAAADVVVSMGGYNTSIELARAGKRAIIVPRQWRNGDVQAENIGVRWEQTLRARMLARLGLCDVLEMKDLSPARLAACIRSALARVPPG